MSATMDARAAELSDQPIPRRYWWLKRLGGVYLVLLLALAGFHWWWTAHARAQLDRRIVRVQAAGEPVLPADFDRWIGEPRGAADPLTQATIAMVFEVPLEPRGKLSIENADYDEVRAARPDDVARLLEANRAALQELRAARDFDGANWRIKVARPMLNTALPATSGMRNLALLARLDSEELHRAGRDGEAIERARDLLHLSRSLVQPPVFLLTHMVSQGIDGQAYRLVEFAAPTLRIGAEGETGEGGGATREQVRALIGDLLAEDGTRRSAQLGFAAERASLLEMADALAGGRGGKWLGAPAALQFSELAKPLLYQDAERAMGLIDGAIAALREESWPAAKQRCGALPTPGEGVASVVTWITVQMVPAVDRIVYSEFRNLATRRMAAIALALRLYEFDHGQKAKSLGVLVPDYLPRLPSDPYAADGRTFGYLPDAERPRLYGVGGDGVDNGGAFEMLPNGLLNRESLDTPFFLDRAAPKQRFVGDIEVLLGIKKEQD